MEKPTKETAKTFGDWAYLAIAKHFNKILKHEADVLDDKDPEDLHQMRVGMRRLRSAIAGFSLALDLPKSAGEKNVGRVARTLGTLRDIDVLGEALKNRYHPTLPESEKPYLNEALQALAKQRRKAFKEFKILLQAEIYKNLKQTFKNWLNRPKYQTIADIDIGTILPDLLLPQVSKLILHPAWFVGIKSSLAKIEFPDGLSQKEVVSLLETEGFLMHDLRKEAKRSRYNMELFTQFYGENYQAYVVDIKNIQTVLGEIQDCFVLAEFLASIFKDSLEHKMPTLSAQLTETRYQKWQEWEPLQRKFLNSHTRKDLHLMILNPTSQSISRQPSAVSA
jgi:CHAD domain-containing protein